MGYRIHYHQAENFPAARIRTFRKSVFTGISFLLFLLGVKVLWPEGRETLQGILFSGDTETLSAALEAFADQLKCGTPVTDALTVFAQQILKGNGYGFR